MEDGEVGRLTKGVSCIYCVYMNATVIFKTDKKLKINAMKRARARGMTLTDYLNISMKTLVKSSPKMDEFLLELEEARAELRAGKGIPAAEVYRRLGIPK